MRALVQHQFGDPAEVLAVEEVALPDPGPGEVRLRVLLSPIHNHDLWTVQGNYGYKPDLPARAGTEALGVIDALGEGVTGLEVGQRVVSAATFGVWAEYVVAPARAVIPVPAAIADDAAAQLISMPLSAISLLEYLDVNEGDWIVQNTANGAVGRLLAQLAAARGVRVLGLVRRAAGVDELAAAGIHDVVATDAENWRERAAEITGGASIRAGVDSVGGKASGDVLSLLGENGTLVVFGAMAAPVMELASGDVIFRQLTVRGFWGSKISAAMDPAHRAALIGEIMQRVAQGNLELPVSQVFTLDQIADAARANFEPGRVGKVLLQPSA